MLRLGEIKGGLKKISRDEAIDAVKKYRSCRDKGWAALAEILGVETGSKEFLALMRDQDLYNGTRHDQIALGDYDRQKARF